MRTALTGYSYQHQVTLLMLSLMDVEREILKLEIEAKTNDKFDDVVISTETERFQIQIKDYQDVALKDLIIEENHVIIKGSTHKLSPNKNIIIFKNIEITPNDKFFNFPCQKINEKVSIISFSRAEIDQEIKIIYEDNPQRKNEINSFLNLNLDKRIWDIPIESLPQLKVFVTDLQEHSVIISHQLIDFENILLIEGKPGVGKSHFVNSLTEEIKNFLLYRFWIGNQDKDYNDRLKFKNFLRDLNSKLFYDQKQRSIQTILQKLKSRKNTFIIDGFDHIENYNKPELELFIDFINQAKKYCKIIVLSRPLVVEVNWKKQILENWSLDQTKRVLDELFFVIKYNVVDQIYCISQGYPIIVRYLAEHYKKYKIVPKIGQVDDINSYYESTINGQKSMFNLSLFLCCHSYIMESEIEMFIGNEKFYVEEFIKEYPYLFDKKLNRISLFHDSFNTFLRNRVNYEIQIEKVSRIVTTSILNLDKRFLSRVGLFMLSKEQKRQIIKRFASIKIFDEVSINVIDYEGIRAFYSQLREILSQLSPNILNVNQYYDLSLIFNLVLREHINTINTFQYTYVQALIANGFTDEDITSSDFLFGMYFYCKTKNAVLLLNRTAKNHYDTNDFYYKLEKDVLAEEQHIEKHSEIWDADRIKRALKNEIHFNDFLVYIMENLYYNKSEINGYKHLNQTIEKYIYGDKTTAIFWLEQFLLKNNQRDYRAESILKDVYENLKSYGCIFGDNENEYIDLTLQQLIEKYCDLGSFNLRDKIHNYIRLSILENRTIDLESIYPFWTKYYQRKDYTFYGFAIALNELEKDKIISMKQCIMFIHTIQKISEKGYRSMLAEFIDYYPPKLIIPFLEENFDPTELIVDWFLLKPKYINEISNRLFHYQKNELIRYHRNHSIPLDEIEHIFFSNYSDLLSSQLNLLRITISYKADEQKSVDKLKFLNLRFEKQEEERYSKKYRQSSKQRFDRNILTIKDLKFIKKNNLQPHEISKFSDGNYASLSDIDIFEIYDHDQVSKNLKEILYNSITSRETGSSYFYYLYYHPGTVMKMIKKYRSNKEFNLAISSFAKYIKLSMFNIDFN